MKTISVIFLILFAASSSFAQTESKRQHVVVSLANSTHRWNLAVAAARIRSGINTERAYRDLDTMLAREFGDMFWMYSLAGFYHSTKEVLPDNVKSEIRNAWKLRTPYRGDTENHYLMYYGSLFLMSEVWPGLSGSEWFTGQSSNEINTQSKEYLLHWMRDVAKHGQGEFDSPRYQYYFYTPIFLLAQYAHDKEVKQLALMTLELLLADYAVKYMNGNYAGAHSRTLEAAVLTGYIGETSGYGQYFFEDSVTNLQPDLAFIALTDYQCPEIIYKIAKRTKRGFTLEESKQPRKQIRYRRDSVVSKYTYFGKGYALGSLQRGLVQPIQQQTWKLLFDSRSTPNTITGLHPYISANELAAYFPEHPDFQKERIESTKAGYSSEDKWIGGSPYQQVDQEKNIILVTFRIPKGISSSHGDLFIPKGATPIDIQKDGDELSAHRWHVFQFDSTFFAIQLLRPMHWIEVNNGVRLRGMDSGGYVIVVNESGDLESFKTILKRQRISQKGEVTRFVLGRTNLMTDHKIKGVRPSKWLYRSPFINSKRGSGVIAISCEGKKRVLNFNSVKVSQE